MSLLCLAAVMRRGCRCRIVRRRATAPPTAAGRFINSTVAKGRTRGASDKHRNVRRCGAVEIGFANNARHSHAGLDRGTTAAPAPPS